MSQLICNRLPYDLLWRNGLRPWRNTHVLYVCACVKHIVLESENRSWARKTLLLSVSLVTIIILHVPVHVYGVNTWQVQCLRASARDMQLLPFELRLIKPSTNYVPSTVLQDSQWTSWSERATFKQHVFFSDSIGHREVPEAAATAKKSKKHGHYTK